MTQQATYASQDKPLHKKVWIWIVIALGVMFWALVFAGLAATNDTTTRTPTPAKTSQSAPKWDAAVIYPQIEAGMTKAETEAVIGKTSDNCTETATPGLGTTELCIYSGGFSGKGSITIDYFDGKVYSKTKTGF